MKRQTSLSWYTERADGVTLALKVKAGAKHNGLAVAGDVLRVEVQAPPREGRANAAAVALLAQHFGCPRSEVVMLHGEHSSSKVVLLRGFTTARLLARAPR